MSRVYRYFHAPSAAQTLLHSLEKGVRLHKRVVLLVARFGHTKAVRPIEEELPVALLSAFVVRRYLKASNQHEKCVFCSENKPGARITNSSVFL